MTTLATVASDILAQAEHSTTHKVTITDQTLGWGGSLFAHMVSADLLRDDGALNVSIDPPQIPKKPAGTHFSVPVTLPATAADSFLGLTSTPGTLTFIQAQGRIQLQLSLTLGRWTLTDSFPALKGLLITQVEIDQPVFLFSTFEPATGDFGTDAPIGLSLRGSTPLLPTSGQFGPLAEVLKLAGYPKTPSLDVSGPISQTPVGPEIDLGAPLGHASLNLGLAELRRPRLIAGVFWPFGSGQDEAPVNAIGLNAEVDLKSFKGHTVALDTTLLMPIGKNFPVVSLSIEPETTFSTSLTNIAGLIGGNSWDTFLNGPAKVLKPMLDHFGLQSFRATISTVDLSIVGWTLDVGTLAPWNVLPGKVDIEEIRAHFVGQGASAGTTFELSADIVLFNDLEFTGSIGLPDLLIAAELKGSISFDTGQLLTRIAHEFDPGSTVPGAVTSSLGAFTLLDVSFSLDKPKGDLSFALTGSWVLVGSEFDFSVTVKVTKQTAGYDVDIGGVLQVGYMDFKGDFQKTPDSTVFTANWSTENPVGIDTLAGAFGFDAPDIPPDLDLALKSAQLVYDATHNVIILAASSANYGAASLVAIKSPSAGWRLFFGLDIDRKFSLSDIPLVGQQLAKIESISIENFQALLASGDIGKTESGTIAGLIGSGYPSPPEAGIAKGVAISVDFDFGGSKKTLTLGVGAPGDETGAPDTPPIMLAQSPDRLLDAAPMVMAPGAGGDDGVTWFQVQKSFGPVTIQRIGAKYSDQVITFAVDGSMRLSGLTIDLIGLTIGSPLSSFDPHFDLQGLGIDYKSPGLTIGGAFLNVPATAPVTWEYAGAVVVSAGDYDIAAVGSYADVSGSPSMFIFGQVQGALGGPPAFFLTGVMGGFGYNRSLRLPEQDEVFKFPLVRGLTEPDAVGGKAPTPLEVLAKLEEGGPDEAPWVTIDVGETWIAAGVQFTSYEIIEGKVLAVVEFGSEFELALIGLASARLPQAGPEVYASVELQIEAIFKPDEGELFFSAVLTPNSFLLSQACKLTGGFAFELWYGPSQHAGNFVVTLGGYSPYFTVPDFYPQEPRLGFDWSLGGAVTIKGGAYFALTPSAVMGGVRLEVLFHEGNLKAWFKANADFLIYFKPFHFLIDVGISVGASYRMNLLFTHKTFTVELGAQLTLWGPPTGGKARIHWWIISFTVSFGASEKQRPSPLDWQEFQALLPHADSIVKTTVSGGLTTIRKPDVRLLAMGVDPDHDTWIVRAPALRFRTATAIPATDLYLGSASTTPYASADLLDIRPMQAVGLTSHLRVWLVNSHNQEQDLSAGWTVEVQKTNVPKALWGEGEASLNESGAAALLQDRPTALDFIPPPPQLATVLGPVDGAQYLAFETLPPGYNPLVLAPTPTGPGAVVDPGSVAIIQDTIQDTDAAASRSALFGALQAAGWRPGRDGELSKLAGDAGRYFTDPPMVAVTS